MAGPSMTPPSKRIKLDHISPKPNDNQLIPEFDTDVDEDHCTICLQAIADRAVIPTCSHEFCFECLMIWSEQSRRCPLCAQNIGDYLIHHIRSTYDYQKHFLPPLRTSPRPLSRPDGARIAPPHRRRERVWGQRDRAAQDEADALERAVTRRRWIYQHDLYAKHVASNKYTRYRPFPTPAQFATSQDLISRMTVFLRRELLVWPNADVEFLVTFVISLMKSIDIRSESAIRLLAEFLDMDAAHAPGGRHITAEHFAHEIYCYLRSPYRDLGVYDSVVQYDTPLGIPPPPSHNRTRRWEPAAPQSRSPSLNPRQLPHSHSPSTRQGHSRNGRSPQSHAHLRERESRRSISLDSLTGDSRVPHDVSSGEDDEDDCPDAQPRSRSHPHARPKGKQRAPARSPTPPPEPDIWCGTPTVYHEPTGSLEIGTASSSTSFCMNGPERNTAAGSTPAGGVHFSEASPNKPPEESHSADVSPQSPDGDPSKLHKTPATDKPRLPLTLEGLHLSNDGIIASSSSMSETSKPPTINRNARANPMRQSRYRSQRDSINAYLRKASATTPRQPSSVPLRSVPSLLTRMTDETVANPNLTASGADTGITQVPDWDGNARLPPHMVELSSRPSVDDDPSERREEGTVTKAESESGAALPPPSHACLLHVEKATTAEARLRKQVRLRARLAAERSLARDDGGKENASTGSR